MNATFRKCRLLAGAAILVFLGAAPASAGTFCVIGMAIPPQCYYSDVNSCIGASSPPNTFCGVNPAATLLYYGTSRFCTVQSDRLAQCMYSDFVQCNTVASQTQTICIDRQVTDDAVNPFKYERRVEN